MMLVITTAYFFVMEEEQDKEGRMWMDTEVEVGLDLPFLRNIEKYRYHGYP